MKFIKKITCSKKTKPKILSELFFTFLKIGCFTFGGGYAMISMFESICVEKKGWISREEMMNVTIVAESTPGPISINGATFIGYKQAGITGAVVATLGTVLPSFAVIYIISEFLDNFLEFTIIFNAFKGIKVAVGILIINAAITMFKTVSRNKLQIVVAIISFIAMMLINIFSWNFSSISLIISASIAGSVLFSFKKLKEYIGDKHNDIP